ncbi:MAG: hypothetical protein U1F43_02280 [Myxococcota bacterium]
MPGAGGQASLGVVPELFQHLRDRYGVMLNRLMAEGRVDEAAFVHAELLERPLEAYELLVKHERFELAATMAAASSSSRASSSSPSCAPASAIAPSPSPCRRAPSRPR